MKKEPFILNRLKSVVYAFNGFIYLVKTESSIQIQMVIAIVMTIFGFMMHITLTEWILQIFAIGLVMSAEGINTAIEKLADFINPDFNEKIGIIKDVAAGAVFISALIAVIIGFIIYLPKFI
ncbi:MAG: diacylglycerol kinase [bacterium]